MWWKKASPDGAGSSAVERFEALAREYAPVVFRYVRLWATSDAEAEDLTQEAFLRAFERRDQLRDQDRFLPWVLTIARHTALNERRRPYRRHEVPLEQDVSNAGRETATPAHAVDPAPDVRRQIDLEHVAQLVDAALEELDPIGREVFLLRYYGEVRTTEIARQLSLPVGTVTAKLCRGLRVLRRHLERAGVTPEDLEHPKSG